MSDAKAEKRPHAEENGEEEVSSAKQSKVAEIKEANANEKSEFPLCAPASTQSAPNPSTH